MQVRIYQTGQNAPMVVIAELYTTSGCSAIGVNSPFQLEASINLEDSLRNAEGTEK